MGKMPEYAVVKIVAGANPMIGDFVGLADTTVEVDEFVRPGNEYCVYRLDAKVTAEKIISWEKSEGQ